MSRMRWNSGVEKVGQLLSRYKSLCISKESKIGHDHSLSSSDFGNTDAAACSCSPCPIFSAFFSSVESAAVAWSFGIAAIAINTLKQKTIKLAWNYESFFLFVGLIVFATLVFLISSCTRDCIFHALYIRDFFNNELSERPGTSINGVPGPLWYLEIWWNWKIWSIKSHLLWFQWDLLNC